MKSVKKCKITKQKFKNAEKKVDTVTGKRYNRIVLLYGVES